MKKILITVVAFGFLLLTGCKDTSPEKYTFGSFNDESYVWESF